MGGKAERRLHFRHGPPPPQGKGDAVSRVWALSRQVLPTGRRLAGGTRGLGPWPGPPPSPNAQHFCRRCPCAGPSSNPPVVSPQSAVSHVCGGDTQTPASVNPKRKRPLRLSGGGLGGPKAKEAPSPQRRGPRWSQSPGGPLASAAGASVVPKPKRPPRLSGGGLDGPQNERGPLASAAGASMVRKPRRTPRLSGEDLDGPRAKEAPSPQRRGPRWFQSEGGPLASAAGASVIPKPRRPSRLSGGGLDGPKAKEAPSPQRRGPRWSQSQRGPLASAAGASVVPKRRRPPRLSRGGLDGPEAKCGGRRNT